MISTHRYPIGIPGQKWTDNDKAAWLDQVTIKRSYQGEVVTKLKPLDERFDLIQYGALSYNTEKYPLFAIKTRKWDNNKPTVLITGGVHGYETSGVHGAINFVDTEADSYCDKFNIIVAPCVSPWGYETINRWNPNAIDPNRSFYKDSPSEESAALIQLVDSLNTPILAHIDLHETTNTDEIEFRPALAARDGIEYIEEMIPDGFYLVGDTDNPMDDFQKAIIESVRKTTHIAPPDNEGKIIGEPITQPGVINYPTKKLGLCSGLTDSKYCTTTEVYPDSPLVTELECNNAQVTAITGALDYISKHI
ncbi:M14 family metallocarboxypeptidase [Photobacterium sp. SDRW27]|uniref:M14 family metallopeptidase n=1 Tax=Photobacterium obscurum TaxID=2829490 RepID=UPI002244DAA0|nr:M14 family metallocarboxypeptidase [Photobacterium obscurum]MCW8329883.1 M14 family metallocarboxypeptidase [Photobacterium obscurum]